MSEGDWVPASIARDKLNAATGKGPEVLVAWASNGLLRSHAEAWERGWREAEKDVNLPKEFWLGTPVTENGVPLDAFSPNDWDSGVFNVMVNETGTRRYIDEEPPYQHTAHFVKFSAEDITRCIEKLNIKRRQRLNYNKTPLSEADLEDWFRNLSADVERISQELLWKICCEAHPNHFISRARIRAATAGRGPGPKPKPL
jgi:hypothetical protein